MNNYSSYYFYQKYETRNGSTTIPVLPITYSLDADGTMPLAVRKTDDPECGATPVQYRWVNMDVSTNYICDGFDKYYKQKKQQSTDGQTWTDVVPAEYRRGDIYEANSPDCGYVTGYIFTGTCPTGSEVFTVSINNNAQVQTEKIADGQWGVRYNNNLISLKSAFVRKSTITSAVATSIINTRNVTNMSSMFAVCSGLTSLDVTSFDTSNATEMNGMFDWCFNLTSLDLSNFDTSHVTNMDSMFQLCRSLTSLDVSNFNTSACTDMEYMFTACSGLTSLDVTSFDTSHVTNMRYMFYECKSLTSLDLSNFSTSACTNMRYMFYYCSGLTSLDLSSFNTSACEGMSGMFGNCTNLQALNLSSFDFSNVAHYYDMFQNCTSLRTIYCSSYNKSWIQARIAEAGLTQSINYIII